MVGLNIMRKLLPWLLVLLSIAYVIIFTRPFKELNLAAQNNTPKPPAKLIPTRMPYVAVNNQPEIPTCSVFVPDERVARLDLFTSSSAVPLSSGHYEADARADNWYRIRMGAMIGWTNSAVPGYNCGSLPVLRVEMDANEVPLAFIQQSIPNTAPYDPETYFLPFHKDMTAQFIDQISSPNGDMQDNIVLSADYLGKDEVRVFELHVTCEEADSGQITVEVEELVRMECNQSARLHFSYARSKMHLSLFSHSHLQRQVKYEVSLTPVAALDDDKFVVELNRFRASYFTNSVAAQDDISDNVILYLPPVDKAPSLFELTMQCSGPDTTTLTWINSFDPTRPYTCRDTMLIILSDEQQVATFQITSPSYVNYVLSVRPRAFPSQDEPLTIPIDFEYGANRSGALPSIDTSQVVYFLRIANFPRWINQPVTFNVHLGCQGGWEHVRWFVVSSESVNYCEDTVSVSFSGGMDEIPVLIDFPEDQRSLAAFHLSVYRPIERVQ